MVEGYNGTDLIPTRRSLLTGLISWGGRLTGLLVAGP